MSDSDVEEKIKTDEKMLKIQVANARPEDSGRGLARLSRDNLSKLGLIEGDVVEILGKRPAPARAVLPYPEDEGLDFVRLDGLQRANSGVGSGDFVEIRKIDSKPAKKAVFAPAQKDLRLHGNGKGLKRSFMGRPLTAGDFVATHGQQQVDRSAIAANVSRARICAPADTSDGGFYLPQRRRSYR